MKSKIIALLMASSLLLCSCGGTAGGGQNGKAAAAQINLAADERSDSLKAQDVSPDTLWTTGDTIVRMNNAVEFFLISPQMEYYTLRISDKELGEALYKTKSTGLKLIPTLETNPEITQQLRKKFFYAAAFEVVENENTIKMIEEDLKKEYSDNEDIMENRNDYTNKLNDRIRESLSAEEVSAIDAKVEEQIKSAKPVVLKDYLIYDNEGHCFGKLTAKELEPLVSGATDSFLTTLGNARPQTQDCYASQLGIWTYHMTQDDISVINDKNTTVILKTFEYNNLYNIYEEGSYFLFSQDFGSGQGSYKFKSKVYDEEAYHYFIISEPEFTEMSKLMSEENCIFTKNLTAEKLSPESKQCIYNNTDEDVVIYATDTASNQEISDTIPPKVLMGFDSSKYTGVHI